MADSFDLIVLGAGPAGYVAAIRAAQLGMKTAVVERERPGGVCLNWGCIPTKALLRSAELLSLMKRAKEFGILLEGEPRPDVNAMVARSRQIVEKLARGVEYLLKKNKIEHVKGTARLTRATSLEVSASDGKKRAVEGKRVILATGGRPRLLPGLEPDGKRILTSKEAMTLESVPKTAVVIGGGAIGCELACYWEALGTKVTIVELLPRLLPVEDEEVSRELERALKQRGIEVLTEHGFKSAKTSKSGVAVELTQKDGAAKSVEAEVVLCAIGVRGNVEDLGLEDLKVEVVRSFVKVGPRFETAAPGLHAIGDVIGPPLLAHKGSAEGIACVEAIAGQGDGTVDYSKIPAGTFTSPQVGSIGLTEAAAKAQGLDLSVGRFPFRALGRAIAVGEDEGFAKLVVSKKHGEILGAHVIGPSAADLIAEVAIAMGAEATVHELHSTVHAHPTLPEALMEAAGDALGRAIHI
ncbi:dihydrolipoyl dehydrogenase [bacterium]|nr:dihydrolipoyl dehydrogenase [bacterium]